MVELDKHALHELGILRQVQSDQHLSNRLAARRLGVSIKLAHQILTGMVARGLLHVRKVNSRRWDYFLTPQGLAEKTRLTRQFLDFSLHFYREARRRSSAACRDLSERGVREVAFVGTGDLAEIAYLGVQEWGLKLAEVYGTSAETCFMRLPVQPLSAVSACSCAAILVCLYDAGEPMSREFLPPGVARAERMHWFF